MVRYIRDHAVYGKVVRVHAANEEDARKVASVGEYWAWETKEVDTGYWEVYIAKHDSVFALND